MSVQTTDELLDAISELSALFPDTGIGSRGLTIIGPPAAPRRCNS